jgi:hypothetical protein
MNKLPDDIIIIISSYYGNKISKELSDEINDQRLLNIIKEKEYYNYNFRTWHLSKVGDILILQQDFIPENLKKIYKKAIWKDLNKIINKAWKLYTSFERKKIVSKYFSYAFLEEPVFITFREFFYSLFNYYID